MTLESPLHENDIEEHPLKATQKMEPSISCFEDTEHFPSFDHDLANSKSPAKFYFSSEADMLRFQSHCFSNGAQVHE